MTSWRLVTYEPLDVVINADARGLADGGYAHEGEIFPAAFAGVLRTEIMRRKAYDFHRGAHNDDNAKAAAAIVGHESDGKHAMNFRFAGPLHTDAGGGLLFPLPRLYHAPSAAALLEPVLDGPKLADTPLADCGLLSWQPLFDSQPEPGGSVMDGFVDAATLGAFLTGDRDGVSLITKRDSLYRQERRWGHTRATGGAPEAGGLFSRGAIRFAHRPRLETRPGGGFAGLLKGIDQDLLPNGSFPARFAGEGRLVHISVADGAEELAPIIGGAMKRTLADAIARGGRLLVYLATPALFAGGWRPEAFERASRFLKLKGAAVGPPAVVAGWDWKIGAAKAPKRAVPAGSVYFFEASDASEEQAVDLVERFHGGTPISDWDGALGFGLAFLGVW